MAAPDYKVIFKALKSAASRRTVALPASLVEILADRVSAVGDGLVFTAPEGWATSPQPLPFGVRLPAVHASVGEPMRFHDLRHTHAAWLIAHGEHAKTIQARLGHASIATTLYRYGHLMPGVNGAAAERLDELMTRGVKHSGSTRPTGTIAEFLSI